MVNEDIITSLKNAIEHKEDLETAKATAINSGYNPRDVEEAAKFIGRGVLYTNNVSPGEVLTMPNQKGFSFFRSKKPAEIKKPEIPAQIPQQKPIQTKSVIMSQPQSIDIARGEPSKLPDLNNAPVVQNQPVKQIKPLEEKPKSISIKKQSYIKEIILLILLLLLIGILILTVKYKETIIGFFS